jgi:hypothetical protein
MSRPSFLLLAAMAPVLLRPSPCPAQTAPRSAPPPLAAAAATITGEDVTRRVGIIADDSMLGRDTPSKGLEQTAQYVADQFRRFGLRPGGENGTWFQRYSISRRRLMLSRSEVELRAGRTSATARLDRSARFLQGNVPPGPVSGPAVLVGGPLTPDAVGRMPLRDKVVLYVPDYRNPLPQNATQVARAIRVGGPRAIITLSNLDSKMKDTNIDLESLEIIEESINTTEKFLHDFGIPKWSEKIMEDFKLIDYDLILNVLK